MRSLVILSDANFNIIYMYIYIYISQYDFICIKAPNGQIKSLVIEIRMAIIFGGNV